MRVNLPDLKWLSFAWALTEVDLLQDQTRWGEGRAGGGRLFGVFG